MSDLRNTTCSPDIHRMLPQDQEAELGLLGSLLLCPLDIIEECIEKQITVEHFHVPANALTYAAICELHADGSPIDFILLTNELRDRGQLDKVGGPAFVTSLFTHVPTAANASYYIEILREKKYLRGVIKITAEYGGRAYEEREDVYQFVSDFEREVLKIAQEDTTEKDEPIRNTVDAALENIQRLYERKGAISGLATGFTLLDRLTDGLQAPDMITIAARPAVGKTAIAMNIAEHVALDLKLPVGVFSLEMSRAQLIQRLICARARVNLQAVRDGAMTDKNFNDMTRAAKEIAESKLFIDDTAALTIQQAAARARRWKKKHGIKLLIGDYLQLFRSNTKRSQDNRQQEVAEISVGVKAIAKDLNLPFIILAQLNRNPENRTGGKGRPRISDLRESGSIEQDSDIIGLLHREELYANDDEEKRELEGEATLIIGKHRNGPIDDIPLTFLKEYTRFENRAFNK